MKKSILLLFSFVLLSCSTRKEVVYYQDIDSREFVSIESINTHPKIQINDILKISTSALNPESVIPYNFNTGEGSSVQTNQVELLKLSGYLVNSEGEINFPQLGKIKVEGETTQDIQDILEEKLSKFIKSPTVIVRIINYKFTVQGEVRQPGTFEIIEENMTLPQALGLAGDLTINGRRDNVLIYRQEGGSREVKRIDLTQTDWMNTEYFFVKPNDFIYVEPNNPKVKSAGFVSNVGTLLSVLSIILSAVVIIAR
ncbi:polysaccharide export outer membrane protein Wza-like protein [Psychroflexus gondwanensis ACAM 44]|uniref:Polysaccharide export outer membrane protein Wza-like protein n=1 Tax=Psychroflexus gondwanensis ACAM 44 TaxID=1189619 RepID=N1WMB1_9FLAO|nr:polysaccharide biosynthesis/export family protein [Psychroflexus gondwanensis]EMY80125.1 polysaccharide export outer membrane protein Wza-like protein [Psychroflexus gondwanensis ACAM 44]